MRHTIKNLLNQEQKNMLKSLKGETFDLLINESGEFAISVLIEAPNRDIIIKNIPTEASDGDEYPKLVIEQAMTPKNSFVRSDGEKKMKGITILRDKVTWKTNDNNWFVEVDIGIKIICENAELLIIAHDSLAGLLKLHTIKDDKSIDELLENYWSMKTDHANSLIREVITIN
ncbi:hypothetical protein [Paenibacillus kribbensis]|uniref:hypothetical protein n=1 Tax=Paenibacillus kribbensis TaxID=172713 RepID=UPI0008381679|nr:hypothetical protein [Paenibacillus kribbensis]